MRAIADLIIRLVDLIEAQAYKIRKDLLKTASAVIAVRMAFWMLFVSLGLGLAAAFLAMLSVLSAPLAALLTAAAALILTGILAGVAAWLEHH
jgi:hypothetical protein